MNRAAYTYWLEQTEADVPAGDHFLSARERTHVADLRFEKRRREWRLGRWTAKHAVVSCLKLPLDGQSLRDVEIRPSPTGAPELFLFNQKANVCVSISHRAGRALCVFGLSGRDLGCDLELIEPRDHSFVTDFFTTSEQRLVDRATADEQPMLATLVWSAKESALKALKVGLRIDTTSLDVSFTDSTTDLGQAARQDDRAAWHPLLLRHRGGQILRGWWRCANNVVRTVVFGPPIPERRVWI